MKRGTAPGLAEVLVSLLVWSLLPATFAVRAEAPRILVPDERPLFGSVQVSVELPEGASAATLTLDGETVGRLEAPALQTRLKIGDLPERHRLEVVALDPEDRVLGRASTILNRGLGASSLRFVSPDRLEGAGVYDVEVEVDTPVGVRPESVVLFWNQRELLRWSAPPYRSTLELPSGLGFLRAVASFVEAPALEATLVWLGDAPAYRTEAEVVELSLVAVDRRGRPIRDLDPFEIEIREEGELQRIRSLEPASSAPLTVALAVDVSESMEDRFETIQSAVELFAQRVIGGPDRAFVLTFGGTPELVQPPTGSAADVVAALEDREAEGETALWDALAYSLVLLRDVHGRRAVVLLSDALDSSSRLSLPQIGELSRRVGVPIYLVWIHDAAPVDPEPDQVLLGHLVRRSGGEVFSIGRDRDIENAYGRIADDLLAQYLLSYSPTDPGREGWREISVRIERPRIRVRTLSGYWAEP